jgi:hypothetical protein
MLVIMLVVIDMYVHMDLEFWILHLDLGQPSQIVTVGRI